MGRFISNGSFQSLSATVEKKRKMLPGYNYQKITLLGKILTEYDEKKEKKEYILDEKCKIETQSNDHVLLTLSDQKDIFLKYSSEKERNIWHERLKRAIRNESTHGIDKKYPIQ